MAVNRLERHAKYGNKIFIPSKRIGTRTQYSQAPTHVEKQVKVKEEPVVTVEEVVAEETPKKKGGKKAVVEPVVETPPEQITE